MSDQKTISPNKTPATGGATVMVASKLPMDLIIRLYDFKKGSEPVMGGGVREFKIAEQRRNSPSFVLTGNSYAQNKGPHQQLIGAYAVTYDIPKAFWEEWLDQNKYADFIVNGLVFAHGDSAGIKAEAAEKDDVKSGLERLDPTKLPKGVETSDLRRAA